MKIISTIILLTFVSFFTRAQTDKNGNPIFNNELIENVKIDNFSVSINYYTIENNIDNKNSSVFVKESPNLNDYIQFARKYPSYFVIISENNEAKFMLVLLQYNQDSKSSFTYNIVNAETNQKIEVASQVWGEITEKRVDELIQNNYDSTSKKGAIVGTNKSQFSFNKMIYGFQSYEAVKEEIIEISKQLMAPKLSTEKEIIEYIKNETINGELDFNVALENSGQKLLLHDGVAYNKKDFAIFLWAKKVKSIGIKSSKSATKLLEEIKDRNLTKPEKQALKKGFDS